MVFNDDDDSQISFRFGIQDFQGLKWCMNS